MVISGEISEPVGLGTTESHHHFYAFQSSDLKWIENVFREVTCGDINKGSEIVQMGIMTTDKISTCQKWTSHHCMNASVFIWQDNDPAHTTKQSLMPKKKCNVKIKRPKLRARESYQQRICNLQIEIHRVTPSMTRVSNQVSMWRGPYENPPLMSRGRNMYSKWSQWFPGHQKKQQQPVYPEQWSRILLINVRCCLLNSSDGYLGSSAELSSSLFGKCVTIWCVRVRVEGHDGTGFYDIHEYFIKCHLTNRLRMSRVLF